MISQVLGFILGIVGSVTLKMSTMMITSSTSILDIFVIWQIFIIVLWLINKLGKGSGGRGVKKVDHDGK